MAAVSHILKINNNFNAISEQYLSNTPKYKINPKIEKKTEKKNAQTEQNTENER